MMYAAWVILKGKLAFFPPWAWKLLGVVIALASAYWFYQHQLDKAYKAGKADSDKEWVSAVNDLHRATELWKSAYESKATQLSTEERLRHEKELAAIDIRANDLRLRGPGKAQFSCGLLTGSSISAPAGGHEAGPGPTDDPLAPVPSEQPLAVVPWRPLVEYARFADSNRDEVISWRHWYQEQKALLEQERAMLPKPNFGGPEN